MKSKILVIIRYLPCKSRKNTLKYLHLKLILANIREFS